MRKRKLEYPEELRLFFSAASARRQRRPSVCAQCGRPIEALGGQRYCSSACRYSAYYRRNQARVSERQRAYRARRRQQQQTDQPPQEEPK
jgi:ferredoxin